MGFVFDAIKNIVSPSSGDAIKILQSTPAPAAPSPPPPPPNPPVQGSASQQAAAAAARAAAAAAAGGGMADTIKTSPQGVPSSGSGGKITLGGER